MSQGAGHGRLVVLEQRISLLVQQFFEWLSRRILIVGPIGIFQSHWQRLQLLGRQLWPTCGVQLVSFLGPTRFELPHQLEQRKERKLESKSASVLVSLLGHFVAQHSQHRRKLPAEVAEVGYVVGI